MEHYLDYFLRFVTELRNTNSRILKEEILEKYWKEEKELVKKYPTNNTLENLFHYVYDYDKQYYVTSANILKKDLTEKGLFAGKKYDNLWSLLDDLSNRVITGHQAIMAVQQFLKGLYNEKWEKLVLDIIDKDLKCGLQASTINKVVPNLIKTYDVCLANKFDPKKHILTDNWVIERKLDGVRCNVINKNGVIRCFSRQGKEITTLGKLITELEGRMPNNTVFDGEVCLVDEKGLESFQGIMKEIKRKNHTIENPLLLCFDMLTLEEFENKQGTTKYTDRMDRLKKWYFNQDWCTRNKVAQHLSIVNYETYSPKALAKWDERVKELLPYQVNADTMKIAGEKLGADALDVFNKALENLKPVLEVKARRVGGSTYQVPMEIRPERRQTLALRWIVDFARNRNGERNMDEKLAGELMDAYNNTGASIKRKDEMHRMAAANKAFAHFKW